MISTRNEVRAFLLNELKEGSFEPRCDAWLAGYDQKFSRRLAENGWLGLTLPERYGGHNKSYVERHAVAEELLAVGAPVAAHWITERQTGPLLLRYGSEEQRSRFLPKIARGECFFCVGMSEPDSGSDLASIRTSASKVPGGWRVNGTKVWTSHAQGCDFMLTLVRTSSRNAINQREGLSQLIVGLHDPGVEIRPIKTLSGVAHFAEVTCRGVYVSDSMLLGSEGDGWKQAASELAYERSGPERFLSTFPLLQELAAAAEGTTDPRICSGIGELVARLMALRRMSLTIAQELDFGKTPAVDAALLKDLGTRFESHVIESVRDAVAPEAASERYLRLYREAITQSPSFTLRGGTNEILRGIISRSLHVLGAIPSTDDDPELRMIGETAKAIMTRGRDVSSDFAHAGLADVRGVGVIEAALVARVAAYYGAPDGVFEDLLASRPLLRAVQLAGAAARVRDLTIQYAAEREQFGQPINRFQAVQHYLAELAGESALADAAVDQALREPTPIRVAAAKIVAGRSSTRVAAIAHQVHGAIGFTQECSLHLFTTRIWRWRDLDGGEVEHAMSLGKQLIGTDIWRMITDGGD